LTAAVPGMHLRRRKRAASALARRADPTPMPHLIANRRRAYNLLTRSEEVRQHFVWESVNAVLYILGGLTFVGGSLFFFPALAPEEDWGVSAFFLGSILYLVVTGHDALEVRRYPSMLPQRSREARLERVAAICYLLGSVLFLVGSAFFFSFVSLVVPGAWCFVIGSLLFVAGAFVNVLEVREDPPAARRLFNLTAVNYVVGSTLFTTASVPYLWSVDGQAIARTLFDYVATQYVVGSAFFLVGGVINFRRAWLVVSSRHAR
jgi:hypothetical protein